MNDGRETGLSQGSINNTMSNVSSTLHVNTNIGTIISYGAKVTKTDKGDILDPRVVAFGLKRIRSSDGK